ncbi:replication initiation protein, partial [Clostridium sporogenes]
MEKNYLVTKSNYFIMNSSYDLSLEEQKLILTLASMVQPDDEEFKTYEFKIGDFMKLLGIEDKSKYTKIPRVTKELMKKVFEIQ